MCGRYRLTAKERYIAEHFDLDDPGSGDVSLAPRYNIAPTQPAAIIHQHPKQPGRVLSLMRWGMIPAWAKEASMGARMINAVAESAAEKPAFREALCKRRCLVPADGFYEWQKTGAKEKLPFHFGMSDDSLFAFAGLWERWRNPAGGEYINSFTILTTSANSLAAGVHDRMPVILSQEDYAQWLDPGVIKPQYVTDLLKPFDARFMKKYPVSTRVNRAQNDDPECIREIVPAGPQPFTPSLFS